MHENKTDLKTEELAASVILDRGVQWKFPAPWYLRIFGRQHVSISIKSIRLFTLFEISRLYCQLGFNPDDSDKGLPDLIQKHGKDVVRIAAKAALNSQIKQWLFTGWLTRFMVMNCTPGQLLEMTMFIATFSNAEAFLNTIRLIGELRMTKPKNLSQEEQGS